MHHGRCAPFSFGYHLVVGTERYFTIMAYEEPGQNESVIQHFSNPDKNFQGVPTGVAGCDYSCHKQCDGCTLECTSADNARTINLNRSTVAKFRRGCDPAGTKLASCNYLTDPQILGDGDSTAPRMSNNGQRIVFTSAAENFADDENEATDVFLFNRESGSVRVVSHGNGVGNENMTADGTSGEACISGGGFWIAFASDAPDLIVNGNTTKHIYVTDVLQMRTKRLSVDTCGIAADGACANPSLSFSGRHLAFESVATNLVDDIDQGQQHIYLRDRDFDSNSEYDEPCNSGINTRTILISERSNGDEADDVSSRPAVSGDGRFVAFESEATNLDSQRVDTLGFLDIFVRRVVDAPLNCGTDAMVRISLGTNQGQTVEANGDSFSPSISHNGRFVVFASEASNIVLNDTQGHTDIFLHDRDADEDGCFDEPGYTSTIRVSIATGSSGNAGDGDSENPQISPDGRYVIFQSAATNFASMSGAGAVGIFVRDTVLEETYRVSLNTSGAAASGSCAKPSISDDARYFAFDSVATNLDPNDTNSYKDIFLRDIGRVFGDLTGDGVVSHYDFELLLQAWGKCECCAADLNGDGLVDEDDYDLMAGE